MSSASSCSDKWWLCGPHSRASIWSLLKERVPYPQGHSSLSHTFKLRVTMVQSRTCWLVTCRKCISPPLTPLIDSWHSGEIMYNKANFTAD